MSRTKVVAIDTLLPETDGERQKLRMLSFVLLGCGIFGFIGAVATYGLGYFLATFYFVIIWITILHTASAEAVLANSCCFAPHKAFAKLRMGYVIGAVGATVGVFFSIGGIIANSRSEKSAWVALSVVALISCLIALPLSIMAAQAANQIHLAIGNLAELSSTKEGGTGTSRSQMTLPTMSPQHSEHLQQQRDGTTRRGGGGVRAASRSSSVSSNSNNSKKTSRRSQQQYTRNDDTDYHQAVTVHPATTHATIHSHVASPPAVIGGCDAHDNQPPFYPTGPPPPYFTATANEAPVGPPPAYYSSSAVQPHDSLGYVGSNESSTRR